MIIPWLNSVLHFLKRTRVSFSIPSRFFTLGGAFMRAAEEECRRYSDEVNRASLQPRRSKELGELVAQYVVFQNHHPLRGFIPDKRPSIPFVGGNRVFLRRSSSRSTLHSLNDRAHMPWATRSSPCYHGSIQRMIEGIIWLERGATMAPHALTALIHQTIDNLIMLTDEYSENKK